VSWRFGGWAPPFSPHPRGLTSLLAIPSRGTPPGAAGTPPVPLGHPALAAGVIAGSTLDGITSPPEHFPPGHPELPDIVFFYR